jgi:hypothetical protein
MSPGKTLSKQTVHRKCSTSIGIMDDSPFKCFFNPMVNGGRRTDSPPTMGATGDTQSTISNHQDGTIKSPVQYWGVGV